MNSTPINPVNMFDGTTGSSFGYSYQDPTLLVETQYTLVTIVVDVSGSVQPYRDAIITLIKEIVDACKKDKKAGNMLLRVITFNDSVRELHGFQTLDSIDYKAYDKLRTGGQTSLYDADISGIEAAIAYAGTLASTRSVLSNAVVFSITDGEDNASSFTAKDVSARHDKAIASESELESINTILVGLTDPASKIGKYLETYKKAAGVSQYIACGAMDAGGPDVNKDTIAKLAGFVARSVSSTSRALGTGGPSKALSF